MKRIGPFLNGALNAGKRHVGLVADDGLCSTRNMACLQAFASD